MNEMTEMVIDLHRAAWFGHADFHWKFNLSFHAVEALRGSAEWYLLPSLTACAWQQHARRKKLLIWRLEIPCFDQAHKHLLSSSYTSPAVGVTTMALQQEIVSPIHGGGKYMLQMQPGKAWQGSGAQHG